MERRAEQHCSRARVRRRAAGQQLHRGAVAGSRRGANPPREVLPRLARPCGRGSGGGSGRGRRRNRDRGGRQERLRTREVFARYHEHMRAPAC
ncbi:unnamed protein product [Ectocarpus sp. 4 AP-2014]